MIFIMSQIMVKARIVPIIPTITCPALILADNRKERVRGRMEDLMPSIIDKKGLIGIEVDSGR